MGKSIARGCKKSLVDQCYEDPVTRGLMMKKLQIVLKREMNVMCAVLRQDLSYVVGYGIT